MNKMLITEVEISQEELFDGAVVKNKSNGKIKTIKVIPLNKTVYECVLEGTFDPNENVDLTTVMYNKHLFELVEEEI